MGGRARGVGRWGDDMGLGKKVRYGVRWSWESGDGCKMEVGFAFCMV